MAAKKSPKKPALSIPKRFALVRRLALALPGAEEGTSYGTPAFKVGKAMFARLHQDGQSLVVLVDFDERAMRMKTDPESFSITDHYVGYPAMLVRIGTVAAQDLRELLEGSWRRNAPQSLIGEYLGGKASSPEPKAKRAGPSRKRTTRR